MPKQTFSLNEKNHRELNQRAKKKNDKSDILNDALREYFFKLGS